MKTIVVQGGTDGIGRGLALFCLKRGDEVLVVGRNGEKGRSFLATADELGAGSRAYFLQADLSLVSENRRVVEEVGKRYPVVDALVLCARHYRSTRLETAEGFENTFALFYLSRFLLSHGLLEPLERAKAPVIMNVAGPGTPMGEVHWDDLQLERNYDGLEALMQGGKTNDLLGVAFAERHRSVRTRYVLFNPGSVATSFSGEYDPATAAHIESMKLTGRPVEEGIAPIVPLIDTPPAEPLTAFVEGRPMPVAGRHFDREHGLRLHEMTQEMLSR
jgi:NAD(P)-dependent dehydrogenase (short-subunit alcohol dehydrogenase family)